MFDSYCFNYYFSGGEFLISATGEVSINMELDFESKQYFELVIEVSDSGVPALTTTTTLGVTVTGRGNITKTCLFKCTENFTTKN